MTLELRARAPLDPGMRWVPRPGGCQPSRWAMRVSGRVGRVSRRSASVARAERPPHPGLGWAPDLARGPVAAQWVARAGRAGPDGRESPAEQRTPTEQGVASGPCQNHREPLPAPPQPAPHPVLPGQGSAQNRCPKAPVVGTPGLQRRPRRSRSDADPGRRREQHLPQGRRPPALGTHQPERLVRLRHQSTVTTVTPMSCCRRRPIVRSGRHRRRPNHHRPTPEWRAWAPNRHSAARRRHCPAGRW